MTRLAMVSLLALTALTSTLAAPAQAGLPGKPEIGTWGFDLAGRDTAVTPGQDFYQWANGRAVAAITIPPDRTNWGSFIALRDLSEQRVHAILEAPDTGKNEPADKARMFYRAFMDETTVEKLGATPLKPDLDRIAAAKTPADFATLMGAAQTGFGASLFGLAVTPDQKLNDRYTIALGQSGLGLPDRDYYIDPKFADKLAKYPGFIEQMLKLAGIPDAHARATDIVNFETAIAHVSWSRAEQRDPVKLYNPMSLAQLQKAAPGFDWAAYFHAAGLGAPKRLVVGEVSAVTKIAALAGRADPQTLRAWLAFHEIVNAAPVLAHAFVDANFAFYAHDLQGQPQQRARWKRAADAAEAALGEAIAQDYVARYYPEAARIAMAKLTHDLRAAFHQRLEHNGWMSPATRKAALAKLAAFDFQIGYPKKWRDYSKLTVKPGDLFGNAVRSTEFEWAWQKSHLPRKVDRDEWEMFPQTVNAYNMPNFNQVVFPAAILQPPFFDVNADPAINYGAIGGVIGHEMTHGFDDEGRQYDAHGKLADWWAKDDAKAFAARATKYGAQFAAMEILPGAHIKPELTMGENIADLGGLTLALEAYHIFLNGKPAPVIDGLTGDQRVFLGWAQVWRAKVRDDAARQRLSVDPHSPPVARVNGPIRNVEGFYSAFGIKPGDKMYLPPDQRVTIW